jgi:FixJ family two-component response regulator
MTSQPTVFVIDDDPQVRRAVGRLLTSAGYRVELFASAMQFLESTDAERPGCLIIDLRLPGLNGIDLFNLLQTSGKSVPIVFLTGYGDVSTSVQAMKAGAVDFLTKPVDEDELLEAIGRALTRDVEIREWQAEREELLGRRATLTRRERQVFELVVQGLLNKQIAGHLGTTEQTVKVHRGRVMQKMQATSIAQLVHLAERLEAYEPVEGPADRSESWPREPAAVASRKLMDRG